MEKIINNPGLQHLAEIFFLNLDVEDMKICKQINKSCKQIFKNPMFWLRKFRHISKESQTNWIHIIQSVKNSDYEKLIISYLQWNLKKEVELVDDLPCIWFNKFRSLPKENQKDWIKVIDSENNSVKEEAIMSYLQWNLKKETLVDLPCYTSPTVQDDFRKKIFEISKNLHLYLEDTKILKIIAPLMDNPNSPNASGSTPILFAALNGHTEIVKILAPLTSNPNAPNKWGDIPIYWASVKGYTEIVKILAPLTYNPNAPNKYGETPIYWAAKFGHTEIVKILCPLTDNPNAPRCNGFTPISVAVDFGHTEIVKILAPLTDNPNAPNKYGITPITIAKNRYNQSFLTGSDLAEIFLKYSEIIKILQKYT